MNSPSRSIFPHAGELDEDFSDEDSIFQDALEERSVVPKKPRPKLQRQASAIVETLEDLSSSPLDALSFLTQRTYPDCSIDPLLEPLQTLESQGIQIYFDWLSSSTVVKRPTKVKDVEQLVVDAAIAGDPREYQRILLETALSQNTIVHLGTGYGKTLIALLLIKEKSSEWSMDKQAVFLVPSVALAIQQTLSLRANLPYTVETACYDTSSSVDRRQKLRKAQILVATHGALLDLLMHYSDHFSMRRFNVLVIDECHYCAGNHSYAIIMKKYYHTLAKWERPHVLGLTASPLVNLRDAHSDQELESMLQTLEVTLDAHLVSAEHLIPDEYRKRAALESVVEYDGSQRSLPSADNLPLHNSRFREFRQLEQLYQDLGPLPVSLYCQALVRELSRNEFENETPQQYHTALQHLRSMILFCDQECHSFSYQGRTDKLVALEQIFEDEIERHGGADAVGLVFTDRRITAVALYNYFRWRESNRDDSKEQAKYSWGRSGELRQQSPISSKIIPPVTTVNFPVDDIFADSNDDPFLEFQKPKTVDLVDHAHLDQFMDAEDEESLVQGKSPIAPLKTEDIVRSPTARTSIRSAVLVRNITNIFNSLSVEKGSTDISEETSRAWLHVNQKIRSVLAMLRRKELNLLFATSIVEEGVDVQACSVVIAFDSIRTTKSYVQMKGRARKAGAKFFAFEDRLDRANKSILPLGKAQAMEQRLQDFIVLKAKQENLEIETNESPLQDLMTEPEIAALRQGFFKAENGVVDLQSAKSLLNRYSISVPLDPFVRFSREALIAHMPDFRENILILPSHLGKNIRQVILPDEFRGHTIAEKRKMLSLMACVRLHCHGLLNHRLLPLTRQDMHNKIRLATVSQFVEVKPLQIQLERFFDNHDSQTIYLHRIHHESEGYSKLETMLQGEGHYVGLITFEQLTETIPPLVMHHKEFGLVTTTIGTSTELICNKEQMNLLRQVFILLMNERWRRHSRSMFFQFRSAEDYRAAFLPYLVGIVSREGSLDWDLMQELLAESQRTREQRQDVVASLSCSNPLPKPRLWTSIKDAHTAYIAFGPAHQTVMAEFPGNKEGAKTYQDYFATYRGITTEPDDQLFDVQRYWTQPSTFVGNALSTSLFIPRVKTSDAKYDMFPELAAVKVPQSICLEATIANAHVGLLTCFLPQVFFAFERSMNARGLVSFCRKNLPCLGLCLSQLSLEAVANAMTSKSCGMDVSYEKMEWFGDAVLKMVQTESLLKSVELKGWIEFLHEGDLSMLRQEMGCNKKLVQVCRQFGLERYILSATLARGMWLPSCLDFSSETVGPKKLETGDKVLADILESLLGLVYLEFDYQTAMAVADELRVTVHWTEPTLEEPSNRVQVDAALLESVKRATGYSGFGRPELVEEAFSHPTARNPEVPSFERLEWVGDAVLCLSTREWIWNNFSDLELSEMVTMESALVSNEVLSFLSVQTGLHRYLAHKDHTLPARIEAYIYSIQEDGCGLWGTDPPKSIADIIESLCGAIYTDSDLSQGLAAVRNILRPMTDTLLTWKEDNQTIRLMHPKKALQEMMGEIFQMETSWETDFAKHHQTATINLLDGNRWRAPDPSSSNVVAYVHWMDVIFVAVSDASAVIARNKACAIAVQTLKQHPHVYQRLQTLRAKMENSISVKMVAGRNPQMEGLEL